MSHMPRKLLLAGVPVVALATSLALAATPGSDRPHRLVVEAHGDKVRATTGSYCISERNVAMCADAGYPLPVHGRLAVAGGDRVVLRLHDRRIARVHVGLVRADDENFDYEYTGWGTRARPVKDHPRRAVFRLPADLEGANRLEVFLRYEENIGDVDYWAGLEAR